MVRFSSSAAGDVVMLKDHAHALLDVIGKSPAERGVITAEQIPQALAALRSAAARDSARQPPEDEDDSDEARERRASQVGFAQRAFPLIDLLERSARKHADITWGV